MRPLKNVRGATLIETMITVAIVAILCIGFRVTSRGPATAQLEDGARASSLLRSQMNLLKALDERSLLALDRATFSPSLEDLARLPNASGTIHVEPYVIENTLLVRLELRWKRRGGERRLLELATVRAFGSASTGGREDER